MAKPVSEPVPRKWLDQERYVVLHLTALPLTTLFLAGLKVIVPEFE